jgi:hypothetical protein
MEELIITLEQAKRLKELGCSGNSYFMWHKGYVYTKHSPFLNDNEYPAYTSQEIIDIIYDMEKEFELDHYENDDDKRIYQVIYPYYNMDSKHDIFEGETEVIAKANLLIHLLEKEAKANIKYVPEKKVMFEHAVNGFDTSQFYAPSTTTCTSDNIQLTVTNRSGRPKRYILIEQDMDYKEGDDNG